MTHFAASYDEDVPASEALDIVTAGIALLIAQSAILNNPFYTEGEVRRFLAVRRTFHKDFVAACLVFADECESGKYGSGVRSIATPLRGISKLLPNQDRQALVLLARILRGFRNIHWQEVQPVVGRLIRQAITLDVADEVRDPELRYSVDYLTFFKNVLRLEPVPAGIKSILRKVILLGKGDGRNLTLGLTPHEEENPGAWFDMSEDEKSAIRNAVNESERVWKDYTNQPDRDPEKARDAYQRSQKILLEAQRRAGVHPNIIRGEQAKEPLEEILKREAKLDPDGPTDFLLNKLRKSYEKLVSEGKKNIPREQRKVLTLLAKTKTLDTFQRIIQEAVDRGIISAGSGLLEDVQRGMKDLGKNKAIKDGVPLAPLVWKPMSVEEFQATHDTGEIEFTEDLPDEQKREVLGRVSRAISDLEMVYGKGFCGKHEKKLRFRFGSGGGFMAKASYFAWDDPRVWQPRVSFGSDYEGVLAHELSHYLDDLLEYKLRQKTEPESTIQYHGNLMGNTGVTMDYIAKSFESDSKFARSLQEHLPELLDIVKTIIDTPDYARWKDKLGGAYETAMPRAVQTLTGQSMYDLPEDHPYHYRKVNDAEYKSQLPPELVKEAEKQYAEIMHGDDRKLRYYYSSVEVWARMCEQYVYHKLSRQGIANPWLNWLSYDDDVYMDEETFEKRLLPLFDRLFNRLKSHQMLASLVNRILGRGASKSVISSGSQAYGKKRVQMGLLKAATEAWEQVGSREIRIKIRSSTDAVFKATLYKPASLLPNPLGKITAVVELTHKMGNFDMQDWWGSSGDFSDAAKKTFGIRGRQSLAYEFKDIGTPIGTPHAASEGGNLVLVYT